MPVLHVPTRWHWSLAEQVTGLLPTQVPEPQVSVCVQAFPSEQLDPSLKIVRVPLAVFVADFESVTFRVIVWGPTPNPKDANWAAEIAGVGPVASMTASPFKSHSYETNVSPQMESGSVEPVPLRFAAPP